MAANRVSDLRCLLIFSFILRFLVFWTGGGKWSDVKAIKYYRIARHDDFNRYRSVESPD